MTEKEAIEYLKRRYWVVGSPCQSKSAGNVRGENWKYGRITECYDRISD